MGLEHLFKIAKLTIQAFTDEGRQKQAGPPFEVQYNPDSISLGLETVFQRRRSIGSSSAEGSFIHTKSSVLDVDLVFDGTGVDEIGLATLAVPSVDERIDAFLQACYRIQSATLEPSYLKLSWGKGVLGSAFDCRLQSANITYTAFDRDGSPLHATMKAKFVEALAPAKRVAIVRPSSPDLSQVRTVLAGDTLPLLCREIYGSAEHHLRVAEANGLNDLRELRPGQELIFPPIASRGEG